MNTFRGTGGQMSISLGSGCQMIRRSYDWRSNDPQPNCYGYLGSPKIRGSPKTFYQKKEGGWSGAVLSVLFDLISKLSIYLISFY